VILPAALVDSADFEALNDSQKRNFTARVNYFAEVAAKAAAAASEPDATLLDSIDDIELDASSIMGVGSNVETAVTPYRIHSSWTFECDRDAMAGHVPSEVASFLATARLAIGLTLQDARTWLQRWAECMHQMLRQLGGSSTFTEAVTDLIVLDALISLFLVFAVAVRLTCP